MTKAVNLVLITLVLAVLCASTAYAQTSEITYQGSLKESGQAANANYDIEFRLFDAAEGGNQIGTELLRSQVPVADGVFSVNLDFGSAAFPGADRYLQISVRRTGVGSLVTLGPRQKVGSVPYALRSAQAAVATNALAANNALSLGGQAASQFVLTSDARLTDARNPLPGSASYIQNSNAPQGANFNISGTGTAGIFNATNGFNFGGSHLISAAGMDNIFAGPASGVLNTSGNSNAFFGARAGQENKVGSFNAFFGAYAGQNNTTGQNNSFFGYYAGNSTTTGSDNSFFGNRAGQVNTSGAFNSFFGTFSGFFNSTGSDNSYFGNEAGYNNTNGNRNSFLGSRAGRENKGGSDNAFVGSFAGHANETGSFNSFVGSRAGQANAAGNNNSFFGSNSGFNNTASNNSFFGTDSGRFTTTGAHNTFVGRNAGIGNTTGELNVFVGVNAGQTNLLGRMNTVVGAEANVATGNLSYATAIGAEAVVTTSNTIVLGRAADTVRVPGGLTVQGTLSAQTLNINATSINGTVATSNGGTGLTSSGPAGRFLRSDGTTWQSQAFLASDIPQGSVHYINNSTIQQGSSNFHISGNGTAGGTLSGNAVNSTTQYNIGGSRVLSTPGGSNLFAGVTAGNANTTGGSNSFFGNSAGSLNTSGSGNSFFGASAGLNSASGGNNTFAGSSAGTGNTIGSNNSFFGTNAGQTNTIGSNNTVLGANANVGGNNLTYATAIGADSMVSTSNTVVLGRNVDTVRVPGNLEISGTLFANTFSIPASNLTGTVAVGNGGTGMSQSGAAGNYLRSNGSIWVSSAIAASDIPAGSANYIHNGVGVQSSSNFNISGNGTVGQLFSANSINSQTNYAINGASVLSTNGANNIFVGAGTATTGSDNSFFGHGAGSANTTGFSNTLIGSGANVSTGNLTFATALGAGASVSNNNSVVLGRAADTVRVPGNFVLSGTFTGSIPSANLTGVIGASNGGTGLSTTGNAGNFLRSTGSGWQSQALSASDIPGGSTSYIQNGVGAQAGASFNIGGNGVIGGNLTVGGTISGTFSVPAGNITGILGTSNGGTGLSTVGSSGHFLKSNGASWTTSLLTASDIPNLSATYVQNSSNQQAGANFNIGGNGVIGGNLTVNGLFNGNVAASNITGTLGISNGGTGLNAVGASGHFLRSNGTSWTTGALSASDIPNLAANYIQNGAQQQAGATFNIGGSGTIGGNLTVGGSISGNFSVPATNITGVMPVSSGGTGIGAAGTVGNFLRSTGSGWTSQALTASDIPAGNVNYIQNGQTAQSGANFNIAGNGTIGGTLTVGGAINGNFTVNASNITGTLGAANGGTGVASPGNAGNLLRSNGAGGWQSSPLTAGDIPDLGGTYIRNSQTQQSLSNFNISGNGIVGGEITAGTVNAVSQYNINGNRVFSTSGTQNIFAGAGTGTSGTANSFFGFNAGDTNSTGSSNTVIGANADVGSGNLTNATAIGANATVDQSNSVVLGNTNVSVGVGTTAPKAKLDVTGGSILVGTPGQGIILKSPNGQVCKLLSIDDTGNMVLANAPCPQ